MKIEYLGHSSFRLTDGAGASIVCDPFDCSIGYGMPEVYADAVSVSHHHYDHDCVSAVGGSPLIFDKPQNFSVGGIKAVAVASYHDEAGGKKRGNNTIFKFNIDGLTVCHLGDLGEPCSAALVEAIGRVNVLLIPVGGTYTIDAAGAKQYVGAIKPDIVIPMHYRTKECKLDIDGVDRFLSLCRETPVHSVAGSSLSVTAGDLNGRTEIYVLGRKQIDT